MTALCAGGGWAAVLTPAAAASPAPPATASGPAAPATAFGPAAPATAESTPADGPTSAQWCSSHGSTLVGWTLTVPDLPICGAGPDYGGSWRYVNLPGPGGLPDTEVEATPGFQCVELAERFLAVIYGLSPVLADGESVAANYHAAYPGTKLYVNGTSSAVGHPPEPGDVLSLSEDPSFHGADDGHVAVVVESSVDRATGDGSIVVAQENVASTDYHKTIDVTRWRLEDPVDPADPEYQFAFAEWLHLGTMPSVEAADAASRRWVSAERRFLDHLDSYRALRSALVLRVAAADTSTSAPFVRKSPPIVAADLRLPLALLPQPRRPGAG